MRLSGKHLQIWVCDTNSGWLLNAFGVRFLFVTVTKRLRKTGRFGKSIEVRSTIRITLLPVLIRWLKIGKIDWNKIPWTRPISACLPGWHQEFSMSLILGRWIEWVIGRGRRGDNRDKVKGNTTLDGGNDISMWEPASDGKDQCGAGCTLQTSNKVALVQVRPTKHWKQWLNAKFVALISALPDSILWFIDAVITNQVARFANG